MSEKIKIKCPRCKHEWRASLEELEKDETVFREINESASDTAKKKHQKYRAVCPVDGTYVIIEVEED